MQSQARLRRSADFDRVRTQGKSWRHPFLILGVMPNNLGCNRFGFVTARRLGNAVTRNRVRRQLREAVRRTMPRLKVGFDITLVARNEILGQPYYKICDALDHLFEQAKLLDRIERAV